MIDLSLIERDIGRILNSHRSMAQRTGAAGKLFHRVHGLLATISDEQTRAKFRAEYRALVERTFARSPSDGTGRKALVAELFLDHARNLKEAEETKKSSIVSSATSSAL